MAFLLALIAMMPLSAKADNDLQVNVYLDKKSSGWASKRFDYALVAEISDCRIQWNAVEEDNGVRFLVVRRSCKLGFSGQRPLHSAILKEIDKRWVLKNFKTIDWGSFCDDGNWSWCKPIAEASLQSKDYIDYWQHYPHSKLKQLNGLFVELANNTNSYKDFSALFEPFGIKIRLSAVEKVFTARTNERHFPEELKALFQAKNPTTKMMYNAGMAYFSISK